MAGRRVKYPLFASVEAESPIRPVVTQCYVPIGGGNHDGRKRPTPRNQTEGPNASCSPHILHKPFRIDKHALFVSRSPKSSEYPTRWNAFTEWELAVPRSGKTKAAAQPRDADVRLSDKRVPSRKIDRLAGAGRT